MLQSRVENRAREDATFDNEEVQIKDQRRNLKQCRKVELDKTNSVAEVP